MITEQSMDSSGSTTDHSSNLSCSPTPPKSALTPPSLGGQSSSPGAGAGGSGRISQNSPPLLSSGGPGPHQLSPPHVSTPPSSSLAAAARLSAHHSMPSLPPSLGLLNSLSNMVHHSPLDLMSSVSHHHPHMPPRSYNSPPPISTSDPTANECKLVDYRGHKVAAFIIAGDTMLCLPQAFELFLKHLVGGLHTVYTKLKRLDIVPLVCNVEQVRILRGLGAIQPGVNRCKLLSCKDFDILYRDCTTASSRPGRPPKRTSSVGLSIAASHLSQLKKHRENGDYGYENGHLSSVDGSRLEKSPLLANGYNHPPTHLNHMQQFIQFNHHPAAAAHTAAAAAALLSHPGLPPPHHGLARPSHDPSSLLKGQPLPPATMDALTRSGIWENCRAAYEDIVKHLERLREDHRNDPDRVLSLENKARDLSSHNGSSTGHSPVLNLSKNGGDHSGSEADHTPQEEAEDDVDSMSDNDDEEEKDHDLMDNSDVVRAASNSSAGASETASQNGGAINYSGSTNMNAASSVGPPSSAQDAAISSTETLLRNIQGLLKVAADNARQQERQISYEKAELKMDVLREREVKESLERQLSSEQKMRIVYEKRYKKERKTRKHFQDQLESEIKRRSQLEEAIKSSCNSADVLRVLSAVEYTTNERGGGSGERERDKEKDRERSVTEHSDSSSYSNSANSHQHNPNTEPSNDKPWNYSGIDLMNPGAIFWQNYSESLQELESERKSRHQQLQQQSQHVDGPDSKSPLQDSRAAASYYKNSVLFSTAT